MTQPKNDRYLALPLLLASAMAGAFLAQGNQPAHHVLAATPTDATAATVTIEYWTDSTKISAETFTAHIGDHGTRPYNLPAGYTLAAGQQATLTYNVQHAETLYRVRVEATGATAPSDTTPATVPATVTYLYNGQIVKTDQFKGTVGDSGSYQVALPAGYQLATGQAATLAYTLQAGTNQFVVQLAKTDKALVPATITYLYSGQVVKTDQFVGTVGETGRYSVAVPNGYHLASGQAKAFAYTLRAGMNAFTVQLTKTTATVPAAITYLYQGRVLKVDSFIGSVGEAGSRVLVAPAGYELSSNIYHYRLTAGMNQFVVNLTKQRQPQITVTIVDETTKQPLTAIAITGEAGSPIAFNRHEFTLPYLQQGYQVTDDATADLTEFPQQSENLTIAVKKPAPHDFSRPIPSLVAEAIPQPTGKAVKTHTETSTDAQRDRPMVYTPFSLGGTGHGGHGGGGGTAGNDPVAAAMVLASYWQALSGVINFGAAS
ncbi:mucin-binding protein [Lacticaseibacillus salsurivasis]|uniref:mucin-binding protein n=1 Tax=Lacticaseibacillus salsurivasis TaxID=3081441 RepID=UPI0030C6BBC7